jgi:hypothetical protein
MQDSPYASKSHPFESNKYVLNIMTICAYVLITRHENRTYLGHITFGHLWPVSLCRIFRHYLVNGTILE